MISSINKAHRRWYKWIIIFTFWFLIWGLLSLRTNDFYLPSPLETLITLLELLVQKPTYFVILSSIFRVLSAFIIALILGITLGIIAGLNSHFFDLLQPVLVAVKSTPVVSFIIITMVYLPSQAVPVFCGILLGLPIIYYNIIEGIHNVDPLLINMATLYQVKKSKIIKKIYFPSIVPYMGAGIITGIGVTWKGTIAAEVISAVRHSIGQNIYNAKVCLEMREVFAWTILIIIWSLLFENISKKLIALLQQHRNLKVI